MNLQANLIQLWFLLPSMPWPKILLFAYWLIKYISLKLLTILAVWHGALPCWKTKLPVWNFYSANGINVASRISRYPAALSRPCKTCSSEPVDGDMAPQTIMESGYLLLAQNCKIFVFVCSFSPYISNPCARYRFNIWFIRENVFFPISCRPISVLGTEG